jgi:hypothetical protein
MTRFTASLLAISLLLFATVVSAQDPQRNFDPIVIPKGQSEIRYQRVDQIPRQLAAAIRSDLCKLIDEELKNDPVKIFRPAPDGRHFAIVPCTGGIMTVTRAFMFVYGLSRVPVPVSFAVRSEVGGFAATPIPGYLEWHPESAWLTATQSSDMLPHTQVRYSYRYDNRHEAFALLKIESRRMESSALNAPWSLEWEAAAGQPRE